MKKMSEPASPVFDGDLLFNEANWADAIQSQTRLFSIDELNRVSEGLRSDFYHGHTNDRKMPEIRPSKELASLLAPYQDRTIGYDLPCLISPRKPSCGRIVLCAQDPLRKKDDAPGQVTVGTFFGIDNERFRHSYRHYPIIWQLVRSCVEAGYEVWLTDAYKIFAGKNVVARDKALDDLCREVLQDEVARVSPTHILALGNTAAHMLEKAGFTDRFSRAVHPTAHQTTKPYWHLKDATQAYEDNRAGRQLAKVHYYCRQIFGTDEPTRPV